MGLDIALMGGCDLEFALDDDIGLGEALFHIPMAELMALCDIRRLGRLGPEAAGEAFAVVWRGFLFFRVLDMAEFLSLRSAGRIVRRLLKAGGEQIVMQDRCIWPHCRLDIGHMG